MNVAEYRAHPALNFSLAKHLLDSPAHFKAAQDEEREETDAMRIGTLAHAMILEGKDLRDLYAIKPEGMSFATKEGKAWKAEQTLPILKEEDANMIPRAAQAIADHPEAAAVLAGCQWREKAIVGTMYGVECKALLDVCGTNGVQWVIADLKTCQDASPRSFAKDVANRHYDLQAVWYSTLLGIVEQLEIQPYWIWLALEKSAPFVNAVYTAESWIESGTSKLHKVLEIYRECTASDQWPMPFRGITKLERPVWA